MVKSAQKLLAEKEFLELTLFRDQSWEEASLVVYAVDVSSEITDVIRNGAARSITSPIP